MVKVKIHTFTAAFMFLRRCIRKTSSNLTNMQKIIILIIIIIHYFMRRPQLRNSGFHGVLSRHTKDKSFNMQNLPILLFFVHCEK